MKKRTTRLFALLALLIAAPVLTGCVGTRLGVDGAALSLIGEEQNILVAFNDFAVQVDPSGNTVPLYNDEDEIRYDENGDPRRWELLGAEIGAQFYSEPLLIDDDATLLMADYAGRRLVTVDLQTARINNSSAAELGGQVIAGLATDGQQVFTGFNERDVIALDLDTRTENWRFVTENAIWSAPRLHEDVLYFGSMDHHVYAVDAQSGAEVWRVDLEGSVVGTPVIDGSRLYAGSFGRGLFAIDTTSGDIINRYETQGWVWGSPVVFEDALYAADLSGTVYALSLDDFRPLWTARGTGAEIAPGPLVTEDYVISASREGYVTWFNRDTGTVAFEQMVEAEILSDILLIEPNNTLDIPEPLVVISTVALDRLLIAFRLENSAQQWVYAR